MPDGPHRRFHVFAWAGGGGGWCGWRVHRLLPSRFSPKGVAAAMATYAQMVSVSIAPNIYAETQGAQFAMRKSIGRARCAVAKAGFSDDGDASLARFPTGVDVAPLDMCANNHLNDIIRAQAIPAPPLFLKESAANHQKMPARPTFLDGLAKCIHIADPLSEWATPSGGRGGPEMDEVLNHQRGGHRMG